MKKLLAALFLLIGLNAGADEIVPQAKLDEMITRVQTTFAVTYKTPGEICQALHRVYGYNFSYSIDRLDPAHKKVNYMLTIGYGNQITYLNTFLILPYTGDE